MNIVQLRNLLKPFDKYFMDVRVPTPHLGLVTTYRSYTPNLPERANHNTFRIDLYQQTSLKTEESYMVCETLFMDADPNMVSHFYIRKLEKLYRDCFSQYGTIELKSNKNDFQMEIRTNTPDGACFDILTDADRKKFINNLKKFLSEVFKIGKEITTTYTTTERNKKFGRGSKL